MLFLGVFCLSELCNDTRVPFLYDKLKMQNLYATAADSRETIGEKHF